MPVKKKVPPTEPAPKPAANDNVLDVTRSIELLERVMRNHLGSDVSLDASQFQDTMDMFLALMHLKKVTPEYWIEIAGLPTKGIQVASLVTALTVLGRYKLSAETKKLIDKSIEINTATLAGIRTKMGAAFKELAEIPPPGTTIN